MSRQKIIGPQATSRSDDDPQLRPQRFADVIGQRDVLERLAIAVEAARRRGEALGHVLFDGPPGLGKTTLATCIPNELGVPVTYASGPALKAPRDLVPFLTNAEERSVLFIDEIHRLPKAVEEYLYTAMEDFRIDIVLGEGIQARTVSLPLKPFTLIGATTRAGLLSAPLRDRFLIREHLDFYELDELAAILLRNAVKLQVQLDPEAAQLLAQRSRGTPRIANNLLRWARDYAQSRAAGVITPQVVLDAMQMIGVDPLGLNRLDRRYLETLIRVFGGGPAGLEAIAHTLNVSADTLQDEVEPFLLRSELLVRTPRGRVALAKAYTHLNLPSPKDSHDTTGTLF
ncbi:MAG: Holliday junction ATP-dependent DNA helicase RuvB [Pirellulaceae bacterium]|nr:MAG: Holliday junction ATP-dependent DNA helicase RuvB [Pirellulaceae bacterium]GIW96538.1 MAG: Holliday junction ATP-dependent DNA helicase RuvB [Pirellulaceae bacterium]